MALARSLPQRGLGYVSANADMGLASARTAMMAGFILMEIELIGVWSN